jgi:hypothetical protein
MEILIWFDMTCILLTPCSSCQALSQPSELRKTGSTVAARCEKAVKEF